MGLDQWATKRKKENKTEELEKVAYWRKNYELHDLLTEKWLELNPDRAADDFYLQELTLTAPLCEEILAAHFDIYTDKIMKQLLEILAGNEYEVVYTSWW